MKNIYIDYCKKFCNKDIFYKKRVSVEVYIVSEKIEYLPLGSIVVVEGGIRKYMIVSRGIQVDVNGEKKFFDYGACLYPNGIIGDQLIYFQHANIRKVVFEGYSDEENKMMVEDIQRTFEKMNLKHEDVQKLKNIMEQNNG